MSKPSEYRETHVLAADVDYRNADKQGGSPHASAGTLRQGRVVWTRSLSSGTTAVESVTAYAEGVGLVELPVSVLSQDRLASLRR